MDFEAGGSSNGRTRDSGSRSIGSNPIPPAFFIKLKGGKEWKRQLKI